MSRSRYKNYWYGIVKKMVQRYPDLKNEMTMQSAIMSNAIENAIADTKLLPDGERRVKAVEIVYVKGSENIDGAAIKLYASRRTVERWLSSFINLVGKYGGYSR
jgi:hypothetical protein